MQESHRECDSLNSESNSRTKNSILNLLASFGGQLLVTVFKFVVRTVFIYTLGKTYLGINGYFADMVGMLSLTELGFDTAINFKLYKPLAEHDDRRVRVLLKFYRTAYRCVGAAILILGLLLLPLLPVLIKDYSSLADNGINPPLVFILYLMQSVFSYTFFAYQSAVMKADQKKYILDVADYAVTVVMNTAQIIVLVLFKNFYIYTALLVLSVIITNAVNALIARKRYPQYFIREEASMDRQEVTELLKDCGALFVYKVNGTVLTATDNMVLGAFAGMDLVGLYSSYLLFYTTIKIFLRHLYTSVKASMGNLFATKGIEEQYAFFETMNFLTVVLYGTAAVGMAACADELIATWIGTEYVLAQPVAIMVGIEILTSGLKQNMNEIRTVTGAFRQYWGRPIVSALVNLVSSVILVQFMGIYGVILGTILADLVNLAVDPHVIHRYSFHDYRPASAYYRRNLTYVLVLAAVWAFDVWLCSRFAVGLGWLSVVIHVLISGLMVPAVFAGVFRKSRECRYLMGIFRRVMKRMV